MTSLLQNGLAMVTQLVMAPVILKVAGQETMGGYAILTQIVGYTLLLDLGFSVALQRFLAQATVPTATSNRFAALFKVGRLFLWVINTTICLSILAAATQLNTFLKVDESVLWQAQIALCLQAMWIVLRTPLAIYTSALNAAQEMAVLNLLAIPINLFRLLLSIALVYAGLGLVGLVAAAICAEMAGGIAQRRFFLRKHHNLLRESSTRLDWSLFTPMLRFGFSYWGVNLATVLLLGSDNLIAGTLFGAATASVFYTTKMIGSLVISLLSRVIDNIFPGAAFLAGRNDLSALRQAYFQLLRYILALLIPSALAIVLFTGWLVTAWVGPQQYAGDLMAIFVALFVLLQVMAHFHAILTLAIGNLRHWTTISIVCGFLGASLGYWLGKYYGVAFITACIALATIPGVVFLIQRVVQGLQLSRREMAGHLKPSLVFLLIAALFYWGKSQVDYSPLNLALMLTGYSFMCGLIIWFFVIQPHEKVLLSKFISRRLGCSSFRP